MKSLTIKAYGKINPTLEVLKKKADGLYALNLSWHRISLFDEVTLSLLDAQPSSVIISCDHPRVPQAQDAAKNNCYGAVKELEAFLQRRNPSFKMPGVSIHIHKRLPLAGGVGGSATDASATLNALISLLEAPISPEEIYGIASRIGHDCLFFCSDFVHAMGHEKTFKGGFLTPLPPINGWLVLVSPPIEIFSGHAYAGLQAHEHLLFGQNQNISNTKKMMGFLSEEVALSEVAKFFCNHLEHSSATFTTHPVLKNIKKSLMDLGCLNALLSGSGATVFGITETQEKAEVIQHSMQQRYPAYSSSIAALLHEF